MGKRVTLRIAITRQFLSFLVASLPNRSNIEKGDSAAGGASAPSPGEGMPLLSAQLGRGKRARHATENPSPTRVPRGIVAQFKANFLTIVLNEDGSDTILADRPVRRRYSDSCRGFQ